MAIPRLPEGNSSRPFTHIDSSSATSMRWENSSAEARPSPHWSTIANSSPPSRATTSCAEIIETIRLATSTSIWSPAAWPMLSLTSLKRSRSRNSTAKPWLSLARARTIASSNRSSRCRRLGSPVSASCMAWWVRRCSARRRSPIWPSSLSLTSASSRVRSSTRFSRSACALRNRSWSRWRASPLPMFWATKVSSRWSCTVNATSGE
ncbi:hypothetical protein D3C71_1148010 [compost metagenome]